MLYWAYIIVNSFNPIRSLSSAWKKQRQVYKQWFLVLHTLYIIQQYKLYGVSVRTEWGQWTTPVLPFQWQCVWELRPYTPPCTRHKCAGTSGGGPTSLYQRYCPVRDTIKWYGILSFIRVLWIFNLFEVTIILLWYVECEYKPYIEEVLDVVSEVLSHYLMVLNFRAGYVHWSGEGGIMWRVQRYKIIHWAYHTKTKKWKVKLT